MKKKIILAVLLGVLIFGATSVFAQVSCSNDKLDASETDIDCGGDCNPCALGKKCLDNLDCKSSYCADGICRKPTTKRDVFDFLWVDTLGGKIVIGVIILFLIYMSYKLTKSQNVKEKERKLIDSVLKERIK